MSGKKAKQARQAQRASVPPVKSTSRSGAAANSFWRSWKGGTIGVAVVAIIAASFVLPDVINNKSTSTSAAHAMAMATGAKHGEGLKAGSRVPAFSERNVENGQTISSKTLYAHKTLLFFSEGVMCQACFEQIKGLEQVGDQLAKRGISLVSITPDSAGDLKQMIGQYGITSPMIADNDRTMSQAFNTLGAGMHADTPGHAFALIDKGKVLWYRDYWLPPTRSMYVEPAKLLAEIPAT